jgi:hypothetical protein
MRKEEVPPGFGVRDLANLARNEREWKARIAELEAALREDHDTFAHMHNSSDPLDEWHPVIRMRVAAIRKLLDGQSR